MRTSDRKLNVLLKDELIRTFSQLLADLKSSEEVEIFAKDFFNESELETYVKRIAVSYWLKKGRSYENIKENLKVSSATIASIQELSQKPGFKLALKKVEAEEWASQWAEKIQKLIKK